MTFLDLGREVLVSVPTLVKRNSGFSDSLRGRKAGGRRRSERPHF